MALGALLPWRGQTRKKRTRTRVEQLANKTAIFSTMCAHMRRTSQDALFSGHVWDALLYKFRITGALASLSTLPPYLLSRRTRAEAFDVPTPVVDALIDLLAALSTPDPPRTHLCVPSARPPSVPLGLSSISPHRLPRLFTDRHCVPTPWWERSARVLGRPHIKQHHAAHRTRHGPPALHEHQDAQNFQLLSECVRGPGENARVGHEGVRDRLP
ncbi:hypothetical protein GGX14DRAFT_587145, partial [Mycena pura]